MEWMELIGILIVAVFIGVIFFYGFRARGPWGAFWPFLLILVGGIWFVAALADPVGPVYYDVAWLDLLLIGLVFAFLMAAATPSRADRTRFREYYVTADKEDVEGPALAVGIWFWLMILLLIIAIVATATA